MAERPQVKTKPVTRDKLAAFLPNHELIRAFENLTRDVSEVLPDAVLVDTAAIEAAQATADEALASAASAQSAANTALAEIAALDGLLPEGGAPGQVPTKNSAADFDYSWQTPPTNPFLHNQSVASIGPGFASDTYLTGSARNVTSRLKQGTRYRCVFDVSKTAAGTAAPAIVVRFGTNGSTADAAAATLTFPAQTAAADEGMFEVFVTFRSVGGAGVIQAVGKLVHQLAATGFSTAASPVVRATSAAFDTTVAGSILGLSVNGGASAAWTVSLVQSDFSNLV
jgi:hypothetical protein